MAQGKLTGREELTATAADDLIHVVDISDTSQDPAGSSYKVRLSNLLPDTGVEADDYGDDDTFLIFTLNAKGQVTGIEGVSLTGTARTFTKQQATAATTLTDGASIAWNLNDAQAARVILGGDRALANPTNIVDGGTYTLIVKQDATGGRTLAFGTAYKWPDGIAPTLSTAPNARTVLGFLADGTDMLGSYILNY